MKDINNFSTSIHTVLKGLIEEKSKRDNVKFTGYQLAYALGMPRSIITKLTHSDESKRIVNPKIETLLKIVEFFKSDGFDITIDDLLGRTSRSIDIQSQPLLLNKELQTVLLYSINNAMQFLGSVDVKLPSSVNNARAFYLEEDIQPFFKIGSIFVVDLNREPSNDTLIAVRLDASEKIQIMKYHHIKNKTILKPLNNDENDIVLMPTHSYNILGVVIQINAKT